jgi:F0F1-type ATP synthase delta subunit
MRNFYKNSIKALVSESMSEENIDSTKIERILSIIRKLPYPYNGIILKGYRDRIISEIEKHTFTLTTAHDVSDDFRKKVKSLFPKSIFFEEKVIDTSVLGGFKAQVGSQVVDTTVKEHIRQLESQFI